ncbi:hypothetical protein U9S86_004543 [Salmonella enterica]|nr:hypothetical protein [Salmonella enterica]EHA9546158.1 hypothetical protein [Salmonella enterica subsp. enterica serovar Braenderup]EBH4941540.1 hypothetical protein [Salmonella enterica]ECK3278464.1 hypothetical protein [Salmonella enterica]ECK6358132.1 hypothetical protein [Salmonella enterica]
MMCSVENFSVEGYQAPEGYRLVKRTDTARNIVRLDALSGRNHSTAYLIAWWHPSPNVVRLRVWRSLDEANQEAIGDLPRAFVAQLLDHGNDIQLQPVNNAFWRGLLHWCVSEAYTVTDGQHFIRNESDIWQQVYQRKRPLIVRGRPKTGDPVQDDILWEHRKTFHALADR